MNTLRLAAVVLIATLGSLAGCQSTSPSGYGASADASCPANNGSACHTIHIREK